MTTEKRSVREHGGPSSETVLKISKEIAIKFIEMGRITPSSFDATFRNIHTTVQEAAAGKK